jgi:hypothetical protein
MFTVSFLQLFEQFYSGSIFKLNGDILKVFIVMIQVALPAIRGGVTHCMERERYATCGNKIRCTLG